MAAYSEHEKLAKISDESQTCGEFIDWLEGRGLHLCEGESDTGRYWPSHRSITKLLAEFFDIDLEKIEAEKRAMLDEIRAANP